MNNNFITVVLVTLIIGLLVCMAGFGIEAYKEINNTATSDIQTKFGVLEKKEDIEAPQIIEQKIDDVNDTFSSENISFQSSTSRTRYFYNQLEDYSKIIYDGMASNKDSMKTGTYKIVYGNSFSDLLSRSDGQEILGKYYQSAIEAFTYDNPEVFYLDPTKMFLNIKTTTKGSKTTYNVYISNSEGSNYLATGFSSEEQINQCQQQIEQKKNEILSGLSGSTENRIKYIHDWLVDNLSYDQTLSGAHIYNLYGALVDRSCVCEGYAKAFKYLLDEAGIDNVIVLGIGTNSRGETENHAWNYIAINGSWYATDVTWDDPVIQGGGTLLSSYRYRYYLKGLASISNDHIANGQFTEGGKVFNYPAVSNNDF